MFSMEQLLDLQLVEGEIALTVDYAAGKDAAIAVLSGVTQMIAALDALDRALLSSVDTALEPVSILNDVQHSSLKILLARAIREVPDRLLSELSWEAFRQWMGPLLVRGKHRLLQCLDADAPALSAAIEELRPLYESAPGMLGYSPPTVEEAQRALQSVRAARAQLSGSAITIQSELGVLPLPEIALPEPAAAEVAERVVNHGREWLKVRYPDMLGHAQWTVQRAGRATRVSILHQEWLDAYHRRDVILLPGDSLDCDYEETIEYDSAQNELSRHLAVIRVHGVKSPPKQQKLL